MEKGTEKRYGTPQILRGVHAMTKRQEMVERRKHKRFQVPIGVFVAFRPHDSKLGEIIDMSMGGLAFCYLATKEPSNGSYKLDIFLDEAGFHLDDVLFDTVTDFETRQVGFTSVTMRRCGVQFGKLTHDQRSKLEYFIQNHTISEV
jgi:hypothetical protein